MLKKCFVFFQNLFKHKKLTFCLFLLVIVSLFQLFAAQITSLGKLQVINTEYFDIIYHEKSSVTAEIIALRADDLYRKAATLLNAPMTLHIPVVITPDTEQLNAFYTSFPYNRIVLYDTVPDSFVLAVYSETIVSIFYHELVHAISLNIRSPFWNFMSKIFGDAVSTSSIISMPTSFKEGATVSFESLDGEGRMNDGKSLHYVVQAKIENCFPSWQDAAGGRDVFPIGPYPYIFGGAFNTYLQQKYGMEKYAKLWENAGKLTLTTGAFFKTYRKDIKRVWSEFQDSIIIPPLASEENVKPLIGKSGNYASLTVCNEGTAFISFRESAVMFIKNNENKPYKICDADKGTSRISFSRDGQYLAITGLIPSSESVYGVRIFDMNKHSFVGQKLLHLRDTSFLTLNDGKEYLVALRNESQLSQIELYSVDDILTSKHTNDDLTTFFSYSFEINEEAYLPVPISNGVALLIKQQGKWFITILSEQQNEVIRKDFPLPDGIVPSDLSSYRLADDKYRLIFTTTVRPSFSNGELRVNRLPFLSYLDYDVNTDYVEFYCQTLDVSGGVYSPVYSDGKWKFISRMADCYKINYFEDIPGGINKKQAIQFLSSSDSSSIALIPEYESSTYNPMKYLLKGFLFPLGNYTFFDGQSITSLTASTMLGFTYLTSDPVENIQLSFGGGINPFDGYIGTTLALSTSKKGFTLTTNGSAVWTYTAFKEGYVNVFTSYNKPVGTLADNIMLVNKINWLYDVQETYAFSDSAKISFSHYRQHGMSTYARTGFETGLLFSGVITPWSNTSDWYSINTGIGIDFQIARLLPFDNPKKLTVNLPFVFSASLIPSSSVFIQSNAKLILFSTEIQKAFKLLPIYTRRFTVTSGYTADWQDKLPNMCIIKLPQMFSNIDSMKLKHGVTVGANFEIVPVIGNFININLKVGADFTWYLLNEQNSKRFGLSICGIVAY